MNKPPLSCGPDAGTHAALNRHRREWSKTCDDCKAFAREYARNRRQSSPEVREQARRETRVRRDAVRLLIARHRSEYLDLLARVRDQEAAS